MNEKKRPGQQLNQTKYTAPFDHFHYYRTGSGGMSLHAKGKYESHVHPKNAELRLRQSEKFRSNTGSYAFIKAATTSINRQRERNKQKHNALVNAQKKEKQRQIEEGRAEMKKIQNKLNSDRRKHKLSVNKWKESER